MSQAPSQNVASDDKVDPWDDLEFIPYVVGFTAVAAVWRDWRERRRERPRLRDRLLRRRRAVER